MGDQGSNLSGNKILILLKGGGVWDLLDPWMSSPEEFNFTTSSRKEKKALHEYKCLEACKYLPKKPF